MHPLASAPRDFQAWPQEAEKTYAGPLSWAPGMTYFEESLTSVLVS